MNPYKWIFIAVLAATVAGDTEILVSEPPAQGLWLWDISKSKISDGAGWNPASSMEKKYTVCDIFAVARPGNWLRTPFIPLRGAKLLDVKMGYFLRNCPNNAGNHCKTRLGFYVYHTDDKVPNPDPAVINYKFVEDITVPKETLPEPGEGKEFVYHGKVVTKSKGLYLAFKDEGVCISIRNFTAGYKYCPEQGRDLVLFPRTISPADNADSVERVGNCSDGKSVSQNKLVGFCLSSGKWNITEGSECLCRQGYELVQSVPNSCKECGKGLFKSTVSNSRCRECPHHSVPNPTRTSCTCKDGFYALMPLQPCETLPLAPLNASASIITTTRVTISWIPRNSVNRTLRYSIDCFTCESHKDKECPRRCGPNVQFQPRPDNISNGNVTVDGLQPGSPYLFRVYSVNGLNKQEKDRDRWKYATVFVRTKDKTSVPTRRGHPSDETTALPTSRGHPSEKLSKEAVTAIAAVSCLCFLLLLAVACWQWLKQRKKKTRFAPLDQDFKFDAFIIYSTVDQKWVTKKLLPTLESKHKIKCCIHYRDFVAGVPFTQNMADSVYNSKKTVAVVSKSFLNSNFCSHELSIALHRLAERGDDSVVVIKLDDVKNSQLPKELRFRSYIDFTKSTDKRTWEFKLVNSLKA